MSNRLGTLDPRCVHCSNPILLWRNNWIRCGPYLYHQACLQNERAIAQMLEGVATNQNV